MSVLITFLNYSMHMSADVFCRLVDIILKVYRLRDKRMLMMVAPLLYRPIFQVYFIEDLIDGVYLEGIEWPLKSKTRNLNTDAPEDNLAKMEYEYK